MRKINEPRNYFNISQPWVRYWRGANKSLFIILPSKEISGFAKVYAMPIESGLYLVGVAAITPNRS